MAQCSRSTACVYILGIFANNEREMSAQVRMQDTSFSAFFAHILKKARSTRIKCSVKHEPFSTPYPATLPSATPTPGTTFPRRFQTLPYDTHQKDFVFAQQNDLISLLKLGLNRPQNQYRNPGSGTPTRAFYRTGDLCKLC